MNNDHQLKTDVLAELAYEPSISADHIGVTAKNGIVTLSGHVETYWQKMAAETAAARVKGVKTLAEEIEVRLPMHIKHGDDEIAAAALNRMAWDVSVPQDAVKVKVEKGHVTLTGTVGQYFQKDAAAWDIRPLMGVTGVTNQITVKPQLNTLTISDDSRPCFLAELKHWLRFNPREAFATGDGLFSATSGNPSLPDWLGPLMFDWAFTAKAENEKIARQNATSAGLAVFVAGNENPEGWVQVGRACQRFALQATAKGLKHACLNQPVEVAALRPDLAAVLGMPGQRPDLVMRFGRGPAMPFSARRPVDAVTI